MRAAARQVLQQKGFARIRPTVSAATTDLQLLDTHSQTAVLGYADGGFALITRDDKLPAVMAYCEGSYKAATENPNFIHYLNTFNGYLDYCANEGIEPRFIHKAATFNPNGVKEIMSCRWDQGGPYNDMCPFVYKADKDGNMDDRRCITGCVATAMAQILYTLYTHQDPNDRREIYLRGAKRYHYVDDNNAHAFESNNLANIQLDWDNMLDTYSATSPFVNRIAVARLMYACGLASDMRYSTGASGTYTSIADHGINVFFEGVKSEYSGYGITDYEQRIYDEFDAGRPVLLSGADSNNNGHAFVGDGYDKEGKIHINLGWSGGGNGFFTIANMAGYAKSQTVNFITFDDEPELHLSDDAPLDELKGKYITVDYNNPAEGIIPDMWYMLYNVGRNSVAHSTGMGNTIQNTSYLAYGDEAEKVAAAMVRFVPKVGASNSYYIQMGTGDYFGGITQGKNSGSVNGEKKAYTTGRIQEKKTKKYFWFKQSGTVLDCNGVGGAGIAGWGSTTPTDTLSNSSWNLLPVTISDAPGHAFANQVNINPEHRYVLVNYDGEKNYYLNIDKKNCNISKTTPSELTLTPTMAGWQISHADNAENVVSMKSADFKLGNGATADELPLYFTFEPLSETPDTDNENLDVCSAFYHIRCETGYMAPQKIALGGTVYGNMGPNAKLTRWLLIDQTALDEMNTDGIHSTLIETTDRTAATIYDLQGRRISDDLRARIIVKEGRKVIK